jgi:hypothetical protein
VVGRNNTHRAVVAQTNGYRFLMNTSEINHAELTLVFKYFKACKVKFRLCLNKISRGHRSGGDELTQ